MRRALITLCLLLSLTPATSASCAVEPCDDIIPPVQQTWAIRAQALAAPTGLSVAWQVLPGQAWAMVVRVGAQPDQLLAYTATTGGSLHIPYARDGGLQVAAGDTVEVRTYDGAFVDLGAGRATVRAEVQRTYLPRVAR